MPVVEEKVMPIGYEGSVAGHRPPVNGKTHSLIPQNTNLKEEDEGSQPRSRISPPKGSTANATQQQVTQPSKFKQKWMSALIFRNFTDGFIQCSLLNWNNKSL